MVFLMLGFGTTIVKQYLTVFYASYLIGSMVFLRYGFGTTIVYQYFNASLMQ